MTVLSVINKRTVALLVAVVSASSALVWVSSTADDASNALSVVPTDGPRAIRESASIAQRHAIASSQALVKPPTDVEEAPHFTRSQKAVRRIASVGPASPPDATPATTAISRFAPSKPMSVLRIVTPPRYRAHSGQAFDIGVTFMASQSVDHLVVAALAEPGLALTSTTRLSLGSLDPGREATATFAVSALSEGRRYITVIASATGPAGTTMTSYAVPVEVGDIVGATVARPGSAVVMDDQGNALIVMRAEEPPPGQQAR